MACKAKIGEHDVHFLFRKVEVGNENVFRFYVPVHDVLGVVQVLQRAKQLLQNKRDDWLRKLIRVVIAEEFIKLAISRQLHHNEQFVITLHKLQNPHDVLIVCYLEHLELLSHQADHVLTI